MRKEIDFATASINEKSLEIDFLKGKKIINIGVIDGTEHAGQYNFAIDYEDNKIVKRIVISSNDLAIWVELNCEISTIAPIDILREKVELFMGSHVNEYVKIVDNPLDCFYSFVTKDGDSMFSLSIEDLKLMDCNVKQHFNKSAHDRNDVDAIRAISLWALQKK